MTSTIQNTRTKKYESVFKAFDENNDGYLEAADFERVVARLAQEFGLEATAPEYRKLSEAYAQTWRELQQRLKSSNDQRISRQEFLAAGPAVVDDASRFRFVETVSNAVFDLVDTDDDERVDQAEFQKIQQAFRATAPTAKQVFQALDTDGDGYLTRQEFVDGLREFFVSPNYDHPGSWFFGRPNQGK